MKFGVREICNVVFRAKDAMKIGSANFKKGQPVLFMDSAKTSTLESAATSVYAQGGRGNTRLVTWEGEKTLTFTVEDALLSPVSFAMLSGAGVVKGIEEGKVVDSGKVIFFELGCRNIVIGIEKRKHVLEHTACGTGSWNKLLNTAAAQQEFFPGVDAFGFFGFVEFYYAVTY